MEIRTAPLVIIILFMLLFLASPSAFAAPNNPTDEILPESPGPQAQQPATRTANSYFDYLYAWLLGFVGLAALFAMVYGGVLYIFSGAIGTTTEAKRWITNGIIGLIIAGGSYLLLRTINPDLVREFNVGEIVYKYCVKAAKTAEQKEDCEKVRKQQ